MITIGNKNYKVCLFDTNAISIILKDSQKFNKLFNKYTFPDYIYAFSPYVLYEIGKNSELLSKFTDFLNIFPSLILKNEVELFDLSISNDSGNSSIWSVIPFAITGVPKWKNKVRELFKRIDFSKKSNDISLKVEKNYLVMKEFSDWAKGIYNSKDEKLNYRIIEAFRADIVGSFLLDLRKNIEIEKYLENEIVKIISYGWYYKFVSDINRIFEKNDVVDIYNITAINYAEVFIGEKNLNNVIMKMIKKNIINKIVIEKAIDIGKDA